MTEPLTVNRALIAPLTGDLAGLWGSNAINPDLVAIDGMLGGAVTISLTNAPVTLTVPAGFTATPSAGPTQSQNAFINFTGTLTGDCTITFPMPGFYIVNNRCVVGAFVVFLASAAPGNIITAPPGECVEVFCDGTNVWYVGLERVGSYVDLAAAAVPRWISASTIPPYLNCTGGTFNATTYPALAALLGGTTLPDSRGSARFALNQGTGRIILSGGFGIDGTTLLAAGGTQTFAVANLPNTNLAVTIGAGQGSHSHGTGVGSNPFVTSGAGATYTLSGGAGQGAPAPTTGAATLPAMSGTAATGGSGLPNLPPGYVGGLTLIRAG
jgi:hypothetical protein